MTELGNITCYFADGSMRGGRRKESRGYVFTHLPLFVCFSVCGYLKNLWTDSDKTWWACWVCDKEELMRYWWRSESGSGCENVFNFKIILHHWMIGLKTTYIAWYLKKLWTDSDETWWTCWVCDKEELIQFWWRSRSTSGYENFFILEVILHHWEIGLKQYMAWYSKLME